MIELRWRSFVRQAEKVGGNLADVAHLVTGDEQVFPTVIVIVEEPGRETKYGFTDSRLSGDVGELPVTGRVRSIVPKQFVGSVQERKVEVRPPIVVIIRAGGTFDDAFHVQAASCRAFGESPVAVVAKEFARIGVIWIRSFVAFEEVKPAVTIIVVPRDHFSDTKESLESIYANSDTDFQLVYVDGNSPPSIARYLRIQAKARGFRLIRSERYLSPNHARNLGAEGVDTRYIIFIDNDVIVAPNWLQPLVQCADETGA